MDKAFKYLIFCAMVLLLSSFNLAHAQTLVDSRMSGSWFDPSHDGEGFVLEV